MTVHSGAVHTNPHAGTEASTSATDGAQVTAALPEAERLTATPLDVELHDHVVGLADLLPEVLQDIVLDTARGVHHAIADRAFRYVPGSSVVRPIHDGVATAVHGGLELGLRAGGAVLGAAARVTRSRREVDVLAERHGWQQTLAIINGLIGDELSDADSPLALPMTIRRAGHDIAPTASALSAGFPDATPRVAVLLHGLMENEHAWRSKLAEHGTTYTEVLHRAGITPVVLRYNTGLHISENGQHLAGLLDVLLAGWPVGVEEVLLIGHSMGGLVIRAAGESGRHHDHRWPERVRHVVTLGSPHAGAPLARIVHSGAFAMNMLPELVPFADILRRRSVGVRDLFHGYLRRADWEDHDPDAWSSPAPSDDVPPLGDAEHHLVGATLTSRRSHPVGYVLGDVMVRWDSASASGREWAREATITHVGPAGHLSLLNHPEISDLLRRLAGAGPAPAPESEVATG